MIYLHFHLSIRGIGSGLSACTIASGSLFATGRVSKRQRTSPT